MALGANAACPFVEGSHMVSTGLPSTTVSRCKVGSGNRVAQIQILPRRDAARTSRGDVAANRHGRSDGNRQCSLKSPKPKLITALAIKRHIAASRLRAMANAADLSRCRPAPSEQEQELTIGEPSRC
jgi:hypothetical protein